MVVKENLQKDRKEQRSFVMLLYRLSFVFSRACTRSVLIWYEILFRLMRESWCSNDFQDEVKILKEGRSCDGVRTLFCFCKATRYSHDVVEYLPSAGREDDLVTTEG